MTAIEHKELKGLTLNLLIGLIFGTISIVATSVATFYGLKADIRDVSNQNYTQAKVTDIRLSVLETQVSILKQQVNELQNKK